MATACSSPDKLREIATDLKAEAKRLGLSLVGITSPKPSARFAKYEEWLAKNYHGELDYMARPDRIARRQDPSLILPNAKCESVIMVGMHYWPGRSGFPAQHDPDAHAGPRGGGDDDADAQSRGVVSSYAWGEDYHTILQARLKALGARLNELAGGLGRFYVDTGAVLERDFAERAGLGFVGKNTLVINPRAGSGFFIGELFSTVALPLDGDVEGEGMERPSTRRRGRPGCGKCRKCMVACPTGAIVEEYVVDARRCISYLTIELKGSIPEGLRAKMGNKVYGCDICQQVCPWNRLEWARKDAAGGEAGAAFSPLFGSPGREVTTPKLGELLALDDATFRRRFAGSAVRRIGRERLARNAAVALGNVGGPAELAVLRRVAERDDSALVREHAAWGAAQIEARIAGGKSGGRAA